MLFPQVQCTGIAYAIFFDLCLQVCPETSEVVALVFVLIRARPPKENKQPHTHGLR